MPAPRKPAASNTNTAQPLAPETITVTAHADQVSCDGGGGALGHPVVWYTFDGRPYVECLYCDRRFVRG